MLGLVAGLALALLTGCAGIVPQSEIGGTVRPIVVSLAPADIQAKLFLAFLPARSEVTSLVALDATGAELGRFDVPAGPDAAP